MECIDDLVISYLDVEAKKSVLRNDIASKLRILPSDIDIRFGSSYNGTVKHYIIVKIYETITKDELSNIKFDYIDEDGCLIFDAGEVII